MDGRAFLDAVETDRREREFPEVTIVLVTASDEQARKGLEGKTVAVLRKPIDVEAFLKLVEQYC